MDLYCRLHVIQHKPGTSQLRQPIDVCPKVRGILQADLKFHGAILLGPFGGSVITLEDSVTY